MHMVSTRAANILKMVTAVALTAGVAVQAQAPHASGTVKAATATSLTLAGTAGDITVVIPDGAKLVQIPPGSTSLSTATPIALSDVATGDKVLVTGTDGDTATSLHATRVVVMKSAAIAQTRAAESAAWQKGGGGLVKSVDASSGNIIVSSGLKTITVQTRPKTEFRRYSGTSVKFEDAVPSTLADVRAGDQLRVRGARNEDGSSIQADGIVTGSFRNFSGTLTAVDGTAGTVTLKDLATKKVVIVKVSTSSDLRRIPAQMAARFAARPAAAGAAAAPAAGGGRAAGGGSARAGMDLSQMLSRLPTETVGGLKVGDAVMIVATLPPGDSAQPSAVTLVAGVEPILQASPQGETTLSPWSMGGGGGGEGGPE
jgi:hypothetical protein